MGSALIVTGMHRSGTSLVASWLQSCGVAVGERLLMDNESNPKGHYEDLDFVELHQQMLDAQGFSDAGWLGQGRVMVAPVYRLAAQQLITKHQRDSLWGWKDPRTTLFLDFWLELLPEAGWLFVYRQPWLVMDSLLRRGNPTFFRNPNFAIAVWQNYNQVILDFCRRYPDRTLLYHIDTLTANSALLGQGIRAKFGIDLPPPELSRYDRQLMHQGNPHHQFLVQTYFPEAIALYNQLQELAVNEPPVPPMPPQDYTPWLARDWADLRHQERINQGTRNHNHQLCQEIAQLNATIHEQNRQAHTQQRAIEELAKHIQDLEQQSQQHNQEYTAILGEKNKYIDQLEQQLRLTHHELEKLRIQAQQWQGEIALRQQQLDYAELTIQRLLSQKSLMERCFEKLGKLKQQLFTPK